VTRVEERKKGVEDNKKMVSGALSSLGLIRKPGNYLI
jgi:hypothetical protein